MILRETPKVFFHIQKGKPTYNYFTFYHRNERKNETKILKGVYEISLNPLKEEDRKGINDKIVIKSQNGEIGLSYNKILRLNLRVVDDITNTEK